MKRVWPGFVALLLGVPCASCSGGGSDGMAATGGAGGAAAPDIASTEQLMEWVDEIYDQGIRRPGYAANEWAVEWARGHFEAAGLEVELDPIDVLRWESRDCELSVWPEGDRAGTIDVSCMAVPFSSPTAGVEARVVADETDGDPAVLAGNIALHRMDFIQIPQALLGSIATDVYDPEGVFETQEATMPFSPRFQRVMDPAAEAGAVGFIGDLGDYPRDTHDYYVPYDAEERAIPGVWVSPSEGRRIEQLAAAGPIEARMQYDGGTSARTSHNVIGRLPGATDEWVVIGTHHDGPWGSAVEDATGMALVVAQARYWASIPRADRPFSLLFLMNGGHMAGGAGLIAFVERNDAFLREQTVVEIHLEHAAKAATAGPDGELAVSDDPEARWWFVTHNPTLERVTQQAIERRGLNRSFLLEPTSWPPGAEAPPTDGAFFHGKVPIVQHLAAPVYLFDSADTPDKVHQPSLVPLTEATIDIVRGLEGETADSLRAQNQSVP